jgi:hypothetical protein
LLPTQPHASTAASSFPASPPLQGNTKPSHGRQPPRLTPRSPAPPPPPRRTLQLCPLRAGSAGAGGRQEGRGRGCRGRQGHCRRSQLGYQLWPPPPRPLRRRLHLHAPPIGSAAALPACSRSCRGALKAPLLLRPARTPRGPSPRAQRRKYPGQNPSLPHP